MQIGGAETLPANTPHPVGLMCPEVCRGRERVSRESLRSAWPPESVNFVMRITTTCRTLGKHEGLQAMIITDCHVHITPYRMYKPEVLAFVRNHPKFSELESFAASPPNFLRYLDTIGVDRALLINYPSPQIVGFTNEVNDWVAEYCKADPKRLLSCGGVDVRNCRDVQSEMDHLLRLGIRAIKMHSPHQWVYPNEYRNGLRGLETVYHVAEQNGIPIIFHTGTSQFPVARNVYADPIYIDDVAVDFPKLKILLAHGGRPLWTETAFFLIRRFSNVYLELSGIPPKSLLKAFPRLPEVAHKAVFGTDFGPAPGVLDIQRNLDEFRALPLPEPAKETMLSKTALTLWPER
jgi:predicted TIM-barrel fold metal-dependent hydrolase